MGDLRLGKRLDRIDDVHVESAILLDHTLIVGAKGMGKTSLGRILLDGALQLDCPVLMVDTTGDMTSRLTEDLELPLLEGFREVSASDSQVRLRSLGLGVIEGLFLRPPGDATPPELLHDELDDLVGALLGLVGFRTKKLSPEFSLIEALVSHSWSQGRGVQLHELVRLIQQPNVDKIGFFPIDDVISLDRRTDLAWAIAGPLGSLPSGSDVAEPRPIDMAELLESGDTAAATVLSFASGADRIQKFILAVLLAKLKTHAALHWQGDDQLRALVYMDEASNLLPASRTAITTAPLLEALDGWRRFGIGLVLVAEEVDDLHEAVEDHCQTWIVGRVPAPEARRTVVHNLDLINPPVDEIALERSIKTLDAGQFILRSCRLDSLMPFKLVSDHA